MLTRTWPFRDSEVTLPSGANDDVRDPAVTITVGSPNRFASAGRRANKLCPLAATVREPSACVVAFAGPEMLSMMVFPVCRLVNEAVAAPVIRVVMDPSGALRILLNSLSTTGVTLTSNPQNSDGKMKGCTGTNCHL